MTRCLIVSCTERKVPNTEKIPAVDRYDGPTFRIIRKYLCTTPAEEQDVHILIVSAEYGLIQAETPINNYDRKMTAARAIELREAIVRRLRKTMESQHYTEIFLALGKTYQKSLEPHEQWLPSSPLKVTSARGGLGEKLQHLYSWLYGVNKPVASKAADSQQAALLPKDLSGSAIIRGVTIVATPEEIRSQVSTWIEQGDEGYLRTKTWYALIGNVEVSPKWLVSRLSNTPVSGFAADEARRVLHQLGIPVIKKL